MTAQMPDVVINDHPRVDLENLYLYFIVRRDINGKDERLTLPVAPDIPKDNGMNSALWRGYVATFRLLSDGRLAIACYDFPNARRCTPTQVVTEGFLTGDFWLVMRPFFAGPNTSIPFRNGQIVENKSEWDIEDQTLDGHVTRSLNDIGLLVDVGDFCCFMPRSLLPREFRNDLESLVNRSVKCEIVQIHEERNNIIVRPIAFPSSASDKGS